MNSLVKCELSNAELIAKCKDWVSKLCKSGGSAWTLRVPVDLNADPDILFNELANRLEVSALKLNEWVMASIKIPLHKAFWNIEEGFKKDCTFPVRIDGVFYGMGEIFNQGEDDKPIYLITVKSHKEKDFYSDQFHRIEWLD